MSDMIQGRDMEEGFGHNAVGKPIEFSGYVDEPWDSIAAMQFSLDDGEHWTDYGIMDAAPGSGISWRFTFTPPKSGWYCLKVRAVHASGGTAEVVATTPFWVADGVIPGIFQASAYPQGPSKLRLRALGGRPFALSSIFRSGELADATEDDFKLISNLGVRTIYDIRTKREVAERPDPLFAGICTVQLEPSVHKRRKDASQRLAAGVIREYGRPEERMRANYRRYATEYPLIGTALRTMAQKGTPALIHCANGKDRTGVLCAVLQRIAGVPMDDIQQDYLAYNALNADRIQGEEARLGQGMTAEERRILRSFLEARPSYLDAFFGELDRAFGGFDRYVSQGLGLAPAQLERLRALVEGV